MFLGGIDSFWFLMVAMIWHLGRRCGITSVTVEFTMVGSSISGPWWYVKSEQSLHVSTRNCCSSSCNIWWKQLPCVCIEKICQQLYTSSANVMRKSCIFLACLIMVNCMHGSKNFFVPHFAFWARKDLDHKNYIWGTVRYSEVVCSPFDFTFRQWKQDDFTRRTRHPKLSPFTLFPTVVVLT